MVGNQLAELLAKVPFTARRIHHARLLYNSARISTSGRETMRQRVIVRGSRIVRYRDISRRELLNGRDSLLPFFFFSLHHPLLPFVFSIVAFFFLSFLLSALRFFGCFSLRSRCAFPPLPVIIEKSYSRWWLAGDYTAVDRSGARGFADHPYDS